MQNVSEARTENGDDTDDDFRPVLAEEALVVSFVDQFIVMVHLRLGRFSPTSRARDPCGTATRGDLALLHRTTRTTRSDAGLRGGCCIPCGLRDAGLRRRFGRVLRSVAIGGRVRGIVELIVHGGG